MPSATFITEAMTPTIAGSDIRSCPYNTAVTEPEKALGKSDNISKATAQAV